METKMLCSDEDAQKLLHDSQISLLQFSTVEVATQISMRNFELFSSIEPTEYIYDLFKLKSKTSCANLKTFEEVINQESFWVATEILRETNQLKRMKIIKHFIKITLHCWECKNFNSMFAIISGLTLAPVARLRTTWENLPNEYEKLFQDLQDLFDPSRNMAKYSNLLSSQNLQTPVIPLFPIIKKDLTFFHEGNDSKVDGLVNFEKLRMIAKEICQVGQMASVNMDPALMFRTRYEEEEVVESGVASSGQYQCHWAGCRSDWQAQKAVPRNPRDKKPVKSETSPVAHCAGPQQKVQSQQLLPQPPHKVSQGLQVPAVSLYPSRKKVQVKDLPPFGYSLAPSGNVDNFSGSGHSEISSRSSIVSNSSFDLVPVPLHDEWRHVHSISIVETNLGVGRMELQTLIEPDQYSLGSYAPVSECRGLYASATIISSPSTEELSHDQRDLPSLDAADSGRGSWTSCSSSSHDNIQTIQHQRSWETLPFGHTHFDYSGDAAGMWASGSHIDQIKFSDHSTQDHRQNQIRESLEQAQSQASWTTSTGYWGEDSEGDMGTISWRGGKDVSIEAESRSLVPVNTKEAKPVPMPAHIPVMLRTTRGLIVKPRDLEACGTDFPLDNIEKCLTNMNWYRNSFPNTCVGGLQQPRDPTHSAGP